MKLKPIKFLALATLAFTLGACSCNGNPETTTTNPETTTDTETTTTSNTETTETTTKEELSGDYQNWAEVVGETQEYFADPLPDFGDSRVTSLDYEYLGTATEAVEEDKVFLTNKENSSAVSYTFYYNADDAKDIVNGFNAKLVKLDYVKGTGNLKNIFTLTIGEKVVAEILIMDANDSSLTFYFLATAPGEVPPEPEETFATYDALSDMQSAYITRAKVFIEDFKTGLVDVEGTLSYKLDWTNETAIVDESQDTIYQYNFSYQLPEGSEFNADSYKALLAGVGFTTKHFEKFSIDDLFNPSTNEFVTDVKVTDEGYLTANVLVLTTDMVQAYIQDISIMLNFATFVETLQATVTKEVREITGNNEYSYTLSFANLLDIESFVGFTLDSTSNGQYAENYEQDGLITKYNFSAIVKEGVYVLNTALSIYESLEDAGFRSVSCAFFNNGGLFNPTTNEYVVLNYSSTAVELTLHVFDSKSASLVN